MQLVSVPPLQMWYQSACRHVREMAEYPTGCFVVLTREAPAMVKNEKNHEYSEAEATKRMNEALKRALNTPPVPHEPGKTKPNKEK
jgi:hypothetical protein